MEEQLIEAEKELAQARERLRRLSLAYRERRRELKRARVVEESSLEQEIALLSLGRDVRTQQVVVVRAQEQYERILEHQTRRDYEYRAN